MILFVTLLHLASYPFWLLWAVAVFQSLCFWWPWQFSGVMVHSVELRMPLSLGLSDIFFMIRWELWVLGGEDYSGKVPFSSHHINGTCRQHALSLLRPWLRYHLAEVVFIRFLQTKVLPSSLAAILYLLEGSHSVDRTFKGWGMMLHLLEEAAFT